MHTNNSANLIEFFFLKPYLIGKLILFAISGPEKLIRRSSGVGSNWIAAYFDADVDDVIETHEWRCVHTVNGIFPSILTGL